MMTAVFLSLRSYLYIYIYIHTNIYTRKLYIDRTDILLIIIVSHVSAMYALIFVGAFPPQSISHAPTPVNEIRIYINIVLYIVARG